MNELISRLNALADMDTSGGGDFEAAGDAVEEIASLRGQVNRLERSREMCHVYAGCSRNNCKLDGVGCNGGILSQDRK